jgi:hypothetical protein
VAAEEQEAEAAAAAEAEAKAEAAAAEEAAVAAAEAKAAKEKAVTMAAEPALSSPAPSTPMKRTSSPSTATSPATDSVPGTITIYFPEKQSLYIDLMARVNDSHGAMLRCFRKKEDGSAGLAEAEGKVRIGDILVMLNGEDVQEMEFHELIGRIRGCTWPLTAHFRPGTGQLPVPNTPNLSRQTSWGDRMLSKTGMGDALTFLGKESGLSTDVSQHWQSVQSAMKMKNFKEVFKSDGSKADIMQTLYNKMAQLKKGNNGTEQQELLGIVTDLKLTGCVANYHPYQTNLIVAKAGDRFLGGTEELNLAWYRATTGGKFLSIAGVSAGFYQPSVDDIGANVCVECRLASDPDIVNFAEVGPIEVEPSIEEQVQKHLASDEARFRVTLRTAPEYQHILVCSKSCVELWRESDANSTKAQPKSRRKRTEAVESTESSDEDEGFEDTDADALLNRAVFSKSLQLSLDPVNVTCFGILFGGRSTVPMFTSSSRERDVIALTVRRLRARAVDKKSEELAAVAELETNLQEIVVEENDLGGEDAGGDGEDEDEGFGAVGSPIRGRFASPTANTPRSQRQLSMRQALQQLSPAYTGRPEEDIKLTQKQVETTQNATAKMAVKIRELTARCEKGTKEKAKVVLQLQTVQGELAALRQKQKEVQLKSKNHELTLSGLKEVNVKLENELVSARSESVEVKMQLVEVSESCQVTNSELLASEARLKELTDEHEKLAAEKCTLQQKVGMFAVEEAGLQDESSRLEGRLRQHEEAVVKATSQLTQAKDEHEKLTIQLNELEQERDVNVSAIDERSKTLEEKANSIAELEEELARKNDGNSFVQSEQGKELNQQHEEAKSNLDDMRKGLLAAREEKKSAKTTLDKTNAKARKCSDSCSELTSKKNSMKRKAQGLARDLKRLLAIAGSVEGIEKALEESDQLQLKLQIAKTERQATEDDLADYRTALDEHDVVRKEGGSSGMMEKAHLADVLLEKQSSLKERHSGLKDKLKDKEMTLCHAKETHAVLLKRVAELEAQLGDEKTLRLIVMVGEEKYPITCEKEFPVSWLLSETIRQHIEKHDVDDPGIIGLVNQETRRELDLGANIDKCIRHGDVIAAVVM